MTITLGSGSDQLTLYQAQETNRSIQGNVTVKSPFNTSAENTLLTGLEAQERVDYDGLVTGNRLSSLPEWPDDRVQAIAEWTANFEAFVNGKQGTGWSFEDTDRDRDINIVIETAGWQRSRAAKYEVEWNLSAIRGNGQMEQETPAPGPVNPTQGATLDGYDLDDVQQTQLRKEQPFSIFTKAFADPGSNGVKADGGPVRTFTLTGQIVGETYRNTFDDHIRSLVGSDTIVEYESAFPGRTTEVMVRDYESTRSAGITRLGEYAIEVVQGKTDAQPF